MLTRAAIVCVVTGAALCLAGGCSQDRQPHASGASPPASTAPTQSGSGTALPDSGLPMIPGRYTYAAFVPGVTLQVPGGWMVGHRHPDFFDIWYGDSASLAFARPAFVIGPHGRVPTRGLTPQRALDELRHNPGVRATAPAGTLTVSGERGPAIDIETLPTAALFGGSDGAFHPGDVHARVLALSLNGAIILVMEISALPPHEPNLKTVRLVEDTVRFAA